MPARIEAWRLTAQAMALLCLARALVAWVPLARWRGSLGRAGMGNAAEARHLAAHVNRAAARLPFPTKCLPRAMALSWMLRLAGNPHAVIFAVRPGERHDADFLHARVEAGNACVLGDLPGPWTDVARL